MCIVYNKYNVIIEMNFSANLKPTGIRVKINAKNSRQHKKVVKFLLVSLQIVFLLRARPLPDFKMALAEK